MVTLYYKACIAVLLALSDFVSGLQGLPVVEFAPEGTEYHDLPHIDRLFEGSNNMEITMVAATLLARNANGTVLMKVNAPVYRDDASGIIGPNGPLLRLKGDSNYTVKVTNELETRRSDSVLEYGIGDTNFHVHGIHTRPGALSQESAKNYSGGDNIFVKIGGKESPDSKPNSITFFSHIASDHSPGTHWYHPHKHGSSSFQAFASFGPIVVEKDSAWLPDINGCKQVREVFESAEEIFMLFTVYPFAPAPESEGGNSLGHDWMYGNYQLVSDQGNSSLCCDGPNSTKALEGTGTNSDIVFLSGGYQPVITMRSGEWQHWRLLVAAYKDNLIIEIVDPQTKEPAKDCEIMLVQKDGVFLMAIPRSVTYMSVSAGGRADVLARCNAPNGTSYDLVSGRTPSPIGAINLGSSMTVTQKLATLRVASGKTEPKLEAKACTPLRPSYAPDLRDDAIKKTNAKVVDDLFPDFSPAPPGCSMSGTNFTFPEPNPYKMEIGKVIQWSISTLHGHPLHTHINPFQIQALPDTIDNTSFAGGWFEAGDYHDTLLMPQAQKMFRNKLRFQPGPYPGYAVTHCHYLTHEDAGCMHVMHFICPEGADVEKQMPYECSQTMPVPGTFVTRSLDPDSEEPNVPLGLSLQSGSSPLSASLILGLLSLIVSLTLTSS